MITIVSGLPRSGTSLMMQMLEAGGLPPLTDGLRRPDASNPRGYYELEEVKRTREDASWVGRAEGRCVKVVSMLLYDLPDGPDYRILFMDRALEEVLASQSAMLAERGQAAGVPDADMRRHYEAHLRKLERWLGERPRMSVLHCAHRDALRDPEGTARRVREFLGLPLDVERMAAAVDPALHRQRAREGGPNPPAAAGY